MDETGLTFPAGSSALTGSFFELVKESKKGSMYKLSSKQSCIHKNIVISVGVDLDKLHKALLKPTSV